MRFDFTENEYNSIIKEAMLNDEMAKILMMKIKGCSIIEIAMTLHISERTVNRKIKELKRKVLKVLWVSFFCRFIDIP